MKEYFDDFLLMVQFMTRIPVNKSLPCDMDNFRRGSVFFPVIGLIVGAIMVLTEYFCILVFPNSISAIFILSSSILVTGGFHIDGWGDVFDGFFSFKGGKEKIIEIMKDSRIGTYSCIAIIINLLVKYSAINYIMNKKLFYFLIIPPVIARCCTVLISYIGNNAKKTGTGNIFIGNIGVKNVIISIVITCIIIIPICDIKSGIILLVSSFIGVFLINKLCEHYIGGLTGDTLGFLNESIEILNMILITVLF